MRYTEYHAGKAVIKDKNKLSEAMEKWQDMKMPRKRTGLVSGFHAVRDYQKIGRLW